MGSFPTKPRCRLAYLALFAVLLLSACEFSFSTAKIKDVLLARGADANFKPIDPTDIFKPDDNKIHALVTLANAPDDTQVKAVWIAVDALPGRPDYHIDANEVTAGSDPIDFSLSGLQPWPTGRYRVEFYLNGKEKPAATREFRVVAAATAAMPADRATTESPSPDATDSPATATTEPPAMATTELPPPTATEPPATATTEPSATVAAVGATTERTGRQTATPTEPPAASPGRFGPITFAEGAGQDGQPLGITREFPAGTHQVHGFSAFSGAFEGAEVQELWYYEGARAAEHTDSLPAAEGSLHVTFSKPEGLPGGTYRLELLVGGEVIQRGEFQVADAPPTVTVPRKRYRNVAHGFSLTYPADWKVTEEVDKISFASPDQAMGLLVFATDLDLELDAATFNKLFLAGITNNLQGLEAGASQDVKVAKLPAVYTPFTGTFDGKPATGAAVALTQGRRALLLFLIAHGEDAAATTETMAGLTADFELLPVSRRAAPSPQPSARPTPSATVPVKSQAAPIAVTIQQGTYQQWGRPEGMDDASKPCGNFNDKRPITKLTASLRVTNHSAVEMADWYGRFVKGNGEQAYTCHQGYDAGLPRIAPGNSVDVTFSVYFEPNETIAFGLVQDSRAGTSARLYFPR